MSQVRIHFVNPSKMIEFYVSKNPAATALGLFVESQYMDMGGIELPFEGEAAAEEIFDISNNPGRSRERHELFGLCRSVSVGDIVEVEGDMFVCAPCGWEMIDLAKVYC